MVPLLFYFENKDNNKFSKYYTLLKFSFNVNPSIHSLPIFLQLFPKFEETSRKTTHNSRIPPHGQFFIKEEVQRSVDLVHTPHGQFFIFNF